MFVLQLFSLACVGIFMGALLKLYISVKLKKDYVLEITAIVVSLLSAASYVERLVFGIPGPTPWSNNLGDCLSWLVFGVGFTAVLSHLYFDAKDEENRFTPNVVLASLFLDLTLLISAATTYIIYYA